MQLNELKVIVTGAAGGMGAHFARRFRESGAKVAVGDVNEALMAELPPSIHRRRLDVSDETDVTSFVAWANEALGGVNALVNNAGIIRDGLLVKKDKATGAIVKMSRADWDAVIGVNLTGATMMVREVAASMIEAERSGVLINVSSISRHGNRGQTAYVAAKSALAANTVTWARELSRYGIRVAAIAPGMIETPMTKGMHQKARDALVSAIPLGRIGDPEDIWHAVRFTAECEYFTGRCVDVDGGLVMT